MTRIGYRLEGIAKRYERTGAGPLEVLRGVNLSVPDGAVIGIAGRSGGGKSTLARIICNIDADYQGMIVRDGRVVERGKPTPGVQLVSQDPLAALNPRVPVWLQLAEAAAARRRHDQEGVVQPGGTRGYLARVWEASRSREVVSGAVDGVGLEADVLSRRPTQLSGGQRQRLVIARALLLEPRLLVLDEPMAALDLSVQARVLNLLRAIREKTSMVVISHDPDVLAYLCETTYHLEDGVLWIDSERTAQLP